MRDYLFKVEEDFEGERIDKYLSDSIEELSRSYIQKLIDDKLLTVNGLEKKANYRLKCDDELKLSVPDAVIPEILPENIPINIVYEDEDVCIVNKPQGMVVHPGAGHYSGTLVNALLYHLDGRLSGINGVLRPGIVHRIDKDTSGLLMICKNDTAHRFIAEQLKDHTCKRTYRAIVHGTFTEMDGTVNAPIGRDRNDRKKMSINKDGKEAITHYTVLETFKGYSYIECRLETGRTHQIRVHMKSINHPLMGDPIYYGGKEPIHCEGQILHAKTIGFVSPTTKEFKLFDSDLPEFFDRILNYLRQG